MRLRFLPLALCLIVAVFSNFSPSIAAHSTEYKSAETVAIADFAVDYKIKSKANKPEANYPETEANVDQKSDLSVAKVTVREAVHFNIIEENSYKSGVGLSERAVVNPIRDANTSEASVFEALGTFNQGLFYGFAIMVVFLNLICYFLFEEKLFLLYASALLVTSVLLFYTDGLMPLIGADGLVEIPAAQAFFVVLAAVTAALFASRYLNLQEVFPSLKWIAIGSLSTAFVMVGAGWSTEITSFFNIATLLSYAVITTYFLTGVWLFSRKNYPKFYVIASFIPILFALDFFVLRSFGIEFLFTATGHLKVALLAEMVLLTYAIMYRMRAIKEESMLRQTEMRIFLKRQEVMNRKSAEKLMEEVYLENLIMHYDLNGLEIKLLQYISEGKENSKIARKLNTSEQDVEELTKELYHKLEISEHIQEDYRMIDAQPDYIYN